MATTTSLDDRRVQSFTSIAQVIRDFEIIQQYWDGAAIEDLSQEHNIPTKKLYEKAALLAKLCSMIAAELDGKVSQTDQACIISYMRWGYGDLSVKDAYNLMKRREQQGKEAQDEALYRDLGVWPEDTKWVVDKNGQKW